MNLQKVLTQVHVLHQGFVTDLSSACLSSTSEFQFTVSVRWLFFGVLAYLPRDITTWNNSCSFLFVILIQATTVATETRNGIHH